MTNFFIQITFLTILLSNLSSTAIAQAKRTTFIGNGGDPLDYSMSLTLDNISSTYNELEAFDKEELCHCKETWEPKLCQILDSLSEKQRSFCADFILRNIKELTSLTRAEYLKVRFHSGEMEIEENGKKRFVEAVANPNDKSITVNRETYESLSNLEREALIVHEHGHFLKHEDKKIDDTSPIGPFETGRDFLNVIGASIAVAGYEVGESRERYAANYSAGWSQFYISASTSTRHGNSTELKNIGNTQEGSHYSLKYFNGWYGFVFGMHDIKYNNYEYPANGGLGSSTLEYKEYTEGFSVGTSFRYFPLAGYKTRFSQLQIHLDLMLTYENYSSTIKDSFVSFSDETEGTGASFAIESLIPIANGFWFNMTIFKGVFVSREWELFDQTQDEMNREFNAGFSYGW